MKPIVVGRGFNQADVFVGQYDRQREAPNQTDRLYLHLSDLLLGMRASLQNPRGIWLDYGSGTSPYRELFSSAILKRADILPDRSVDYPLVPGDRCPAPAASFDGILSTQVLEHVADPQAYLDDCWRLLKPGGRVILTTHGIWEEHRCPQDYWRWTAEGLSEQLRRAGFQVEKCFKLTTGCRAMLQLLIQQRHLFLYRRRHPLGLLLHLLAQSLWRCRALVARFADRLLASERISTDPDVSVYLGVLVEARKY